LAPKVIIDYIVTKILVIKATELDHNDKLYHFRTR